jgi:outer membrane receptor protein involved in Fe transport
MGRLVLSVCLALAVPISGASAQQRNTRADSTRRRPDSTRTTLLAPIVVSGSRTTGVDERTPVQVDDIDLTTAPPGPAAAYQLLARLPGVSLFDDQGSRLQPELDLRGFTVSPVIGQPQGVSVFLDGVRINEPDAQEVNFDLVPIDAVSHAELVRGPSAIFGKNSLAGSLLLYTDRGDDTPGAKAELEGGPYGYRGGRVTAGGKIAALDAFVLARFSDENGWREETGARARMLFGNIGRRRDSSDVALTLMYANDKLFEAGSLPESYLHVDPRLNYTPGDFFRPELWHVALRGQRSLGGGKLRGNAFWRRNAYEQYNGNVPPPNADGFVRNLSTGGLLEWARSGRTGAIETELTLGSEYSHADVDYRFLAVSSPGVPADAGDLANLECEVPSGLCTDVQTREDNAAIYAQATATFTSSVSITAALRGDYGRLPIADRLAPANGGTSTYWRASPKVGLNYRLADDVRGYAAINAGFRAPAALELSCAEATVPCALPFALGADPPLQPVKVLDYEAGFDYEPMPRTNLDLAGFIDDVRDDILFVQPNATTGFFQNVPRTRRAGVETSGSVGLPAGARLYGSYSYLAATYRTTVRLASALDDEPAVTPGDRFPNSPQHRASVGLGITRAIAHGALDAAAELRAVSSQYLRGDEANVRAQLPGYAVSDVRLAAHLPRVTVRGYVSNLFDRRFVSFGVYAPNVKGPLGGPAPADPADALVERFLTPGQPRLFTVSVSIER